MVYKLLLCKRKGNSPLQIFIFWKFMPNWHKVAPILNNFMDNFCRWPMHTSLYPLHGNRWPDITGKTVSIVILNSPESPTSTRAMNIWIWHYSWAKLFSEERTWNESVISDFDTRTYNLIPVSWCDKFENRKPRRTLTVVCKDKNVTIRGVILDLRYLPNDLVVTDPVHEVPVGSSEAEPLAMTSTGVEIDLGSSRVVNLGLVLYQFSDIQDLSPHCQLFGGSNMST